MKNHFIPLSARFHFFVGTSQMMNIHTAINLKEGESLTIDKKSFFIVKIKVHQQSSYYNGLFYYELKFKIV